MFKLNQASFSVPGRVLLHPVDLSFEAGKVYGLIGHNGSGKSTLLKLLTRQYKPSQGDVLLNGKDIQDYSARYFAQEVAYLPQHLPSASALKAHELVEMGRYAWNGLLGRSKLEDKKAISKAFALTHTEAFADQLVDTLSGGERSRVWLAMCLAQQSRFLLLDEPLAALDIAHQLEVMQLIRTLSKDLGLGIIIVIHDINLASQYCDELVALKKGHFLRQGTPHEMMTSTVLKDIYSVDMKIIKHPDSTLPIALV